MAWRAITRDDLLTAMAAAELQALEQASLETPGQTKTELVNQVIDQVTDYARSRLAVRYQLGARDLRRDDNGNPILVNTNTDVRVPTDKTGKPSVLLDDDEAVTTRLEPEVGETPAERMERERTPITTKYRNENQLYIYLDSAGNRVLLDEQGFVLDEDGNRKTDDNGDDIAGSGAQFETRQMLTDTISDKVLRPCLDLIVPILQRRVQIDPSDNRMEAEKQAVKFFDLIAKGDAVVEEPAKDTSEEIGFINPLFDNRNIVVNRETQSGI